MKHNFFIRVKAHVLRVLAFIGDLLFNLKVDSLAFRLFASALMFSLLVLPIIGSLLFFNHKSSVQRLFDNQLEDNIAALSTNLFQIVKQAEHGDGGYDAFIGKEAFSLPLSGWYWQISSLEGCNSAINSASLLSRTLARPKRKAGNLGTVFADQIGPYQKKLRVIEQIITDENLPNKACQRFSVLVTGDVTQMKAQQASFAKTLIISLTLLGVGLAFATLVQVHYGLAPLGVIRKELEDIRSGNTDRLHGHFPAEIMPLRHELNSLIDSNHEVIERSRTHVGNLAHALKTPLSVITNEVREEDTQLSQRLLEQTQIMKAQIAHHLDRARMVARVNMIGAVTNVEEAATPLVRVMNRISEDKGIVVFLRVLKPDLKFQGEKQDFEEMLGNLLENACNWAKKNVVLKIDMKADERFAHGKALWIIIEDDGPGLPEDQLKKVLKRGKRLDENKPGSGLGLSIVAELADLYKGQFYLENQKKSGLRAVLVLPPLI